MLFNSIEFLCFFPFTVIVYFIVPQKTKNLWLLIMSYIFYMGWSVKYSFLIFFVTCITYAGGILLNSPNTLCKKYLCPKRVLAGCIGLNLILLGFFKYYNFFAFNANRLTNGRLPTLDVILPVGISFYIFQSIGYIVDVYRKDIKPEKNFLLYALYISFFPQLVAGPIERSQNLLKQLRERHDFDYEKIRGGLILMVWGLCQKIVIADRAAILVNTVFGNYVLYNGVCRLLAAVCFGIQIYCDFCGYTNMAIGAAKVMGFSLVHNFNTPYFAISIKNFWRRWHISLSQWFRDYLYIPLGGGRCSKVKKYRNLMITFLLSGLWHGAGWNYILWGGVHGIYQILSEITEPIKKKINEALGIHEEAALHRLLRQILTFLLVDIAWIFFRADSLSQGVQFLWGIFMDFQITAFLSAPSEILTSMGLPLTEFLVLAAGILVLWAVGRLKQKISVVEWICQQNFLGRWLIYLVLILIVLVYGIYGSEYAQTQFIYFQF